MKISETFYSTTESNIHKQDIQYNINLLLMVSTGYKELIRKLFQVDKQVAK